MDHSLFMIGIRLPTLGESEAERRARELFNEGVRNYEDGNFPLAIQKWKEAVSWNVKMTEAFHNLHVLLHQMEDEG